MQAGNWQQILNSVRKTPEQLQNSPVYGFYRANAFYHTTQYEEALRILNLIAELKGLSDNNDIYNYFELKGNVLYELGRKEEAIVAWSAALRTGGTRQRETMRLRMDLVQGRNSLQWRKDYQSLLARETRICPNFAQQQNKHLMGNLNQLYLQALTPSPTIRPSRNSQIGTLP